MIPFQPQANISLAGQFTISSHGFFFLVAALLTRFLVRKDLSDQEKIHLDRAIPFMVLGSLLLGRLFNLFYQPTLLRSGQLWRFWEGGMVSYGGALGALAALYLYRRHHKLPTLAFLNRCFPLILLGWAIGRMGCLLNWQGEAGLPGHQSWCFHIDGHSYHPVILYLMVAWLLGAFFLTHLAPEAQRFSFGLIYYGSARLFLEQWRDYGSDHSLRVSQLFCLTFVVTGMICLRRGRIHFSSVESEQRETD